MLRRTIAGFVLFILTAPMLVAAAEPSKLVGVSHGAAGEVAGSLHILDTGNARWMVDCGTEIDKDTEHVLPELMLKENQTDKPPAGKPRDRYKVKSSWASRRSPLCSSPTPTPITWADCRCW